MSNKIAMYCSGHLQRLQSKAKYMLLLLAGVFALLMLLVALPQGLDTASGTAKRGVDAQLAAGKGLITIYGVSSAGSVGPWANFLTTSAKTLANCLLGSGVTCTAPPTIVSPAPGSGVSCPSGWSSVFAGYGPYTYINRQFFYAAPSLPYTGLPTISGNIGFTNGEDIFISEVSNNAFGATYSICGSATYHIAQTDYSISDNTLPSQVTGVGEAAGIFSACSPQSANTFACNTCRICQAP